MSRHRRQQRKRAGLRAYCTAITPLVADILRGRFQAPRFGYAITSCAVERFDRREGIVYARAEAWGRGAIHNVDTTVRISWVDMAAREDVP